MTDITCSHIENEAMECKQGHAMGQGCIYLKHQWNSGTLTHNVKQSWEIHQHLAQHLPTIMLND